MAVATGIVAGASGVAGGVSKFFEGRKMQRQAQELINNFEWKNLENPYEELEVSTMGADLQREEAARMSATSVDAIRAGGNRALANIGRVQAQNNLMNKEIGADLDRQQKTIDYSRAQDDARIREMLERRQSDELAGYGNMLNQGLGMKYQGIGNIVNGLGSTAQFFGGEGETSDGSDKPSGSDNPFSSINMGDLQDPNSASLNYGNPYNV